MLLDLAERMSAPARRKAMVAFDALVIPLAIWISLSLRWGFFYTNLTLEQIACVLATTAFSLFVFLRLGLYHAVIRFIGHQAFIALVKGMGASALFLAACTFTFAAVIPRSVPIIYFFIGLFLIGGPRFLVRAYLHAKDRKARRQVIIYGAGAAGRELMNALNHGHDYTVVAFIDDNPELAGTEINGVRVYQRGQLPWLVENFPVSSLLLAMPSISTRRKSQILKSLENYPLQIKTMPSMAKLLSGEAWADQLEDLDIVDLIGRESIKPDTTLIEKCIRDKVVMVTGAGGSIGSELCRQIIKHGPRQLVLYELSEFALYAIEKELKNRLRKMSIEDVELIGILGSVQDEQRLSMVMSLFSIDTIYHAAAYKHVPIVEHNMVEGVRNNVFGTYLTAKAAREAGVSNFVLISTDKAVRPTNIMGASKRFAELILQAFAQSSKTTCFTMVRFGNVLGSSGSVVPLFREQIRKGGPVTVTHPDITRFFMTIPEAAQLVLQAAGMAKGGEVFVLDMGEPVSIAELAKRMIRLMGHQLKTDRESEGIEIIYTGLRPGEKLHEELVIGSEVSGTEHPRIMCAQESFLSEQDMMGFLSELENACETMNCERLHQLLRQSGAEYHPNDALSDHLWCALEDSRPDTSSAVSSTDVKVVPFKK